MKETKQLEDGTWVAWRPAEGDSDIAHEGWQRNGLALTGYGKTEEEALHDHDDREFDWRMA